MNPMTCLLTVRELARPLLLTVLGGMMLSACRGERQSDAFGNFEATEVIISAQAQGRLLEFDVREGDRLERGEQVGLVDTTHLAIQRRALLAQRRSLGAQRGATLAQLPEIGAQADVLRARLETAQQELDRTKRLFDGDAATERELNQRQGEVSVLRRQIEQVLARTGTVRGQAASVLAQIGQIDAQLHEIDERIQDARVVNPERGTVLTVTAEQGETVQTGTPLYTIADLDTLRLRAYATGDQLPRLRIGSPVEVVVDDGDGRLAELTGPVTWVAAEAQFTPTPIQTRDERAELVYAFEVAVPNREGRLKVGMPGEVRFAESTADRGD